jgi:hypothetical protein
MPPELRTGADLVEWGGAVVLCSMGGPCFMPHSSFGCACRSAVVSSPKREHDCGNDYGALKCRNLPQCAAVSAAVHSAPSWSAGKINSGSVRSSLVEGPATTY